MVLMSDTWVFEAPVCLPQWAPGAGWRFESDGSLPRIDAGARRDDEPQAQKATEEDLADARAVAQLARSDGWTLREVAGLLERLRAVAPAGGTRWSASMVQRLLVGPSQPQPSA